MTPLVSIILVNYNGRKYLSECLTSLMNQLYRNFDIILVDNKSSDDSLEFVGDNFPDVKIIKNENNIGFAYACNIGIRASEGSLICLLNQDVIADKEWLSTLVYVIQTSENIAAVGGKEYLWDVYGKTRSVYSTWSKIDPYTACGYIFNKGDEPMSKVDFFDRRSYVGEERSNLQDRTFGSRIFSLF